MQETHHTHFAVSDVCICVFCFDPYQFSAGFVYFASLVGSLEWGELKRGGAGGGGAEGKRSSAAGSFPVSPSTCSSSSCRHLY